MDDIIEEIGDDPFKIKCAILVSALALVLAISSLGGSNAEEDAQFHNLVAANTYSFFQAKNVRQTEYKIAADMLELKKLDPKLTAEERQFVEKKHAAYLKTIERYESEPETNEGKRELLASAKESEKNRDTEIARGPWFDAAEALLQIGIVLTSVALIGNRKSFFYVSLILGLVGVVSTVNGFMLLI